MPSRTELFLDDAFIEMSGGVSRRIHAPRKHRRNPVMVPDRWWEGDIVLPGLVTPAVCVVVLHSLRLASPAPWVATRCESRTVLLTAT